MAQRKPFLLRLDEETLAALQSWAADDLRSVNGQVEFLLRRALRDAGRLPRDSRDAGPDGRAAGARGTTRKEGTAGTRRASST